MRNIQKRGRSDQVLRTELFQDHTNFEFFYTNVVHVFIRYFCKIYFNIILPSTTSSKWSLSLRFFRFKRDNYSSSPLPYDTSLGRLVRPGVIIVPIFVENANYEYPCRSCLLI